MKERAKRETLLPSDWFNVPAIARNWTYPGRGHYYARGMGANFAGFDSDIGPMMKISDAGDGIGKQRAYVDEKSFIAHVQK